ncbi:MAG: hypothetical protein ACKVKM_13555 [Verrucomicrobiia bacterium]
MSDLHAGPELAADGFAAAQPHGLIEELFDNVFMVHGSISLLSAGPIWQQRLTPEGGTLKPDFDRLLALDFKHQISAHGALARDTAQVLTEAAVAKAFQE